MSKRRTTKAEAVEQAVEAFARALDESTSLPDAVPQVRKRLKSHKNTSTEELLDAVLDCPRLTWRPDVQEIIPRNSLYQDVRLVIKPLPLELELGILVPGHRPYPYCCVHLLPHQVTFLAPDGNPVPLKKVRLTYRDAAICHTLLMPEDLHATLADANPKRKCALEDVTPEEELDFLVFDFASVYEELGIDEGHMLTASVRNWNDGVFALDPESFTPPAGERVSAWVKHMDEAVTTAFEVVHAPHAPAVTVLAWALEIGHQSLLADPPMGLGAYLAKSLAAFIAGQGILGAKALADGARLLDEPASWASDDEDGLSDPDDKLAEFDGEAGQEIDRLLQLIQQYCDPDSRPPLEEAALRHGIFYTADEIDSIMRDELSKGSRDIRALKRRLAPAGLPDNQSAAGFADLLATKWRAVKREYNGRDEPDLKKELRRKLLEASDARVVLLQQIQRLGLGPQELPEEDMAHLSVASEHLRRSLTVLESADGLQLPVMAGSVTNLHSAINRLTANVVDAFRGQWRLV